jgi:hypothetical protein
MNGLNSWFWAVAKAVAMASGFLMLLTTSGYGTENAHERRDARDTKQDTRQDSRKQKVDCKAANQKNNAECRQDKRDTKQSGRQESRDVRAGEAPNN